MGTPLLVVVAGPPAAGKSTLAAGVAHRLGLPLVSRDLIKFSLISTNHPPAGDLRRGGPVAERTFALFEKVIQVHLEAGASVVVEQSTERGKSEAFLRMFEDIARIQLIYCRVSRSTSIARFERRIGSAARPNPTDHEILAGLRSGAIDYALFEPLDVAYPSIVVDCESTEPIPWEHACADAVAVVQSQLRPAPSLPEG